MPSKYIVFKREKHLILDDGRFHISTWYVKNKQWRPIDDDTLTYYADICIDNDWSLPYVYYRFKMETAPAPEYACMSFRERNGNRYVDEDKGQFARCQHGVIYPFDPHMMIPVEDQQRIDEYRNCYHSYDQGDNAYRGYFFYLPWCCIALANGVFEVNKERPIPPEPYIDPMLIAIRDAKKAFRSHVVMGEMDNTCLFVSGLHSCKRYGKYDGYCENHRPLLAKVKIVKPNLKLDIRALKKSNPGMTCRQYRQRHHNTKR